LCEMTCSCALFACWEVFSSVSLASRQRFGPQRTIERGSASCLLGFRDPVYSLGRTSGSALRIVVTSSNGPFHRQASSRPCWVGRRCCFSPCYLFASSAAHAASPFSWSAGQRTSSIAPVAPRQPASLSTNLISVNGTFETCRRALGMSANRGRPEVNGARSERRD
jgi:hypothetical protein